MSFGGMKTFTVLIASGASTSSDVPLGGRPWARVGVQVGSMSTAVNLAIQNSTNGGSTFYNVFHQTINSATVATPQLVISQVVGANGGYCALPAGSTFQHIRFVGTAVVSGGVSITVVCSD